MTEKTPLNRRQMAARVAQEFREGWLVNLGIGIPTLCSNFAKEVIFHSENGVIGYGPQVAEGEENINMVNAGGQHVSLLPGGSIVHHADAFAIIRAGYLDVSVLGSYEVAENGDFANWKTAGRKGGGIGGAMDLAVGAKQVFIIMEHTTRDGGHKLLNKCTLPITAPGVVKMLVTDLGLFEITPEGFKLVEHAPGWSPEEIQEQTEAKLIIADDLKEFRFKA